MKESRPPAGSKEWFAHEAVGVYRCRLCGAVVHPGGSGVTETRRRHVVVYHGFEMSLAPPPLRETP